jgi:hypothetical protein
MVCIDLFITYFNIELKRTKLTSYTDTKLIDNGLGIWKKACFDVFITYFNIELKRTKLTSHTDTKLLNMSDRYWLMDDDSPDMEKGMH